jgi:hypothetical protein
MSRSAAQRSPAQPRHSSPPSPSSHREQNSDSDTDTNTIVTAVHPFSGRAAYLIALSSRCWEGKGRREQGKFQIDRQIDVKFKSIQFIGIQVCLCLFVHPTIFALLRSSLIYAFAFPILASEQAGFSETDNLITTCLVTCCTSSTKPSRNRSTPTNRSSHGYIHHLGHLIISSQRES